MFHHLLVGVGSIRTLRTLGGIFKLLDNGAQLWNVVPGNMIPILALGEFHIADWTLRSDGQLLRLRHHDSPLGLDELLVGQHEVELRVDEGNVYRDGLWLVSPIVAFHAGTGIGIGVYDRHELVTEVSGNVFSRGLFSITDGAQWSNARLLRLDHGSGSFPSHQILVLEKLVQLAMAKSDMFHQVVDVISGEITRPTSVRIGEALDERFQLVVKMPGDVIFVLGLVEGNITDRAAAKTTIKLMTFEYTNIYSYLGPALGFLDALRNCVRLTRKTFLSLR